MARKTPLFSKAFLWVFVLALVPGGASAGDCDNAALFDRATTPYGGSGGFAAVCKVLVQSVKSTQQTVRAELRRVGSPVPAGGPGESQAGAFHANAGMEAQGSAAEAERKKIAEQGASRFLAISRRAQEQRQRLGQEFARVVSGIPAGRRDQVQMQQQSAAMDFANLDALAQAGVSEAKRSAKGFGRSQVGLAAGAAADEATARRFRGQQSQDEVPPLAYGPPAAAPPAAPGSGAVSANTLVAVGGAGLVVAGAVGGLYWVSQRAIGKANGDLRDRLDQADSIANARIAQADAAAAARIDQAQGAANALLDRAERVIQLAVGSVTKVIANAQAAASRIYEMAKKDFTNLLNIVRAQLLTDFKLLTTDGLKELTKEITSLFDGLIARAQAEGNAGLATSLTQLKATLLFDIQQEISRRAGSGSSASGTSTATGTSTSTATSTGTG